MGTVITTDSNKYSSNSQLKTADDTGRNQLLPIDSDWVVMNPALFGLADTYLSYTGNALVQFAIVDRIRIRANAGDLTPSSDGYYYLVVFAVEEGKIHVSNYDFIPNDIQEIRFSKFVEPTGWPYQLLNNSVTDVSVWNGSGTLDISTSLIDVAYRQIGREIMIDEFSSGWYIISGSGNTISIPFPGGVAIVSLEPPPNELEVYEQRISIYGPTGNVPAIVSTWLGRTLTFEKADGTDWSDVGQYFVGSGIRAIIKPYVVI